MLTLDLVKQIEHNLILQTEGFDGIKDENSLRFIIEEAESIKDIFERSSYYLYNILIKKPFIDKNRAMSILLFELTLKDNAKEIEFDDAELFDIVRNIQDGNYNQKDVVKLLNKKENFD